MNDTACHDRSNDDCSNSEHISSSLNQDVHLFGAIFGERSTDWISPLSCLPSKINVLMTSEMHNFVNNFYSTVFSCSTCFERITRSSSGALPSTLYLVSHSSVRESRPACMILPTVLCNTVFYACTPDDERLDSFETCRADKKLWNKNWL
jgi:hypothetical protein